MKKILQLIVLSILSVGSYAANPNPEFDDPIKISVPLVDPKLNIVIDQYNEVMFSTLKITCIQRGLPPKWSDGGGSGFLWVDRTDTGGKTYLVTNKHVAGLPCDRWTSRQYSQPTDPWDISLKIHAHANTGASVGFFNVRINKPSWMEHKEKDVDLCALEMDSVFDKIVKYVEDTTNSQNPPLFSDSFDDPSYYKNWKPLIRSLNGVIINSQSLLPFHEIEDLWRNNHVPRTTTWMIGYPDGRIDEVHNLPLLRKGIISNDPRYPFNGKKELIIDMESTRGSSGSPVLFCIDRFPDPAIYFFVGIFFLSDHKYSSIEGITWNPPFNPLEVVQYQHLDEQNKRFPPYFVRR